MYKILEFKYSLVAFLSTLFVITAYELRKFIDSLSAVPSVVVAVISALFGGVFALGIVNVLIRRRWLRRRINASIHVEGYWWLTTKGEGESPLDKDGILYICHEPSTGETKVVTTRIADNGDEYPTVSKIAYVRTVGTEKSYLNHFELTYPGPGPRLGLSSGKFIDSDDLRSYPNLMEAHVILTGEGVVRRQIAERIDDKIISELQKKHGSRWKSEALKSSKDVIFNSSTKEK